MDLKNFADLERKDGNPESIDYVDLKRATQFVLRYHAETRKAFNKLQREQHLSFQLPHRFLRLQFDHIERVREFCRWIVCGECEEDRIDYLRLRRKGWDADEIVAHYSTRAQCAAILHECAFFDCTHGFATGLNVLCHARYSRQDAYVFLTKILHKNESLAQTIANAVARHVCNPYMRRKAVEPIDTPKFAEDWILRDAEMLDDGDIFGIVRQLEIRQLPHSVYWKDDDEGDFHSAFAAVVGIHGEAFSDAKLLTSKAICAGLAPRAKRLILAVTELNIQSMEYFREFFPSFLVGEHSALSASHKKINLPPRIV